MDLWYKQNIKKKSTIFLDIIHRNYIIKSKDETNHLSTSTSCFDVTPSSLNEIYPINVWNFSVSHVTVLKYSHFQNTKNCNVVNTCIISLFVTLLRYVKNEEQTSHFNISLKWCILNSKYYLSFTIILAWLSVSISSASSVIVFIRPFSLFSSFNNS